MDVNKRFLEGFKKHASEPALISAAATQVLQRLGGLSVQLWQQEPCWLVWGSSAWVRQSASCPGRREYVHARTVLNSQLGRTLCVQGVSTTQGAS